MNSIKMYTMVEVMLERNTIDFLDWMIHSNKFKNYMINHEMMTQEQLKKEYETEVGIAMLRGKALELYIEETHCQSSWSDDRFIRR